MSQSQLPSGFIEYSLEEQVVFSRMIQTITQGYERSGFTPLDTTAIGYSEVLLAKAGGDLDKEIYRFTKGSRDLSLRFDLTVPMARFMAEHYHTLVKPTRVYQVGKVWRAEKPQKGRYRELYQADIDILGDDSRLAEAEIIATMNRIFENLQLPQSMFRISNRKILAGLLEYYDVKEMSAVLRHIDKMSKLPYDIWSENLRELSLSSEQIVGILSVLPLAPVSERGGTNNDVIELLKSKECNKPKSLFATGVQELEELVHYLELFQINNYRIDLSIVRGQDYYTGTVFETQLAGLESIGSVCSGGRYDNLVSAYAPNIRMTGFGASIGVSRLFGVLRETDWIQKSIQGVARIILASLTQDSQKDMVKVAQNLREKGVEVETYPQVTDFGTMIQFANKKHISYIGFLGADEVKTGEILLKNLNTREQEVVLIEGLEEKI